MRILFIAISIIKKIKLFFEKSQTNNSCKKRMIRGKNKSQIRIKELKVVSKDNKYGKRWHIFKKS